MFKYQNKTNFPPTDKPLFVWDGNCGFCRYWIIRWKIITGDKVDYIPFQKLKTGEFADIPLKRFEEAVRFIEPDGTIYSGPGAAYRSLFIVDKYKWLYRYYLKSKLFRKVSDYLYNVVAGNRHLFSKISTFLLGNNPRHLKYDKLIIVTAAILILIIFLIVL